MIFIFLMPDWLTGFNFLMGLLTLVLLIAGAVVVLLVRGRSEVATVQMDRATATEAMLKLRDSEIASLTLTTTKRIEGLEEELESVTAEHRTLVGIDIGKLMAFWATKEQMEARMLDLEKQLRIEKLRNDGGV